MIPYFYIKTKMAGDINSLNLLVIECIFLILAGTCNKNMLKSLDEFVLS